MHCHRALLDMLQNESQLCIACLQVIRVADIPMKIMFANTISVHLTVYRENLPQLETVLGIIVPEYTKNGECFATF